MAAEAIVSAVVQTLGTLLLEKTISFTTSFIGVHEKFEHLQEELKSIKAFLSTADLNHNQDPDIHVWVSAVRDIAYDVDDVIDAFLHKVAYYEEAESSFKRFAHKPKKVLNCYKLNKKMEILLSRLKEISERRKRYDGIPTQRIFPSNTRNTNDMLLRRVYSHTPDDFTIGLEEQTNELVTKLLKEEDQLCVVSIYGMGGLGKTTLAKKVYNHRDVKSHFHCIAWTSISQQLDVVEVLKEMLRKVSTLTSKDMGEMGAVELVGKFSAILDGKRYFVVLDDIWSTEAWDILRPAFPNNKGSKVMLTTRNLGVAKHVDPWSSPFEPRILTVDEAWELLYKKASPPSNFVNLTFPSSSDLEECGIEMVKKCGGLPLAVIVLGGILQLKRSLSEWEIVSNKIGTSSIEHGVRSILFMSYDDLPCHLKPLFLYLGLFPEDSNIEVKKLLRMWMAESLIKKEEGETIEAAGRQHLDELINRCMVQISEKSLGGERAKTCRLHDKMRDLCIDIGKKENFFEVVSQQNSDSASSSSPSTKLRRCSIYIKEKSNQYVFPKHFTPCLRTVFFNSNESSQNCPNMVYNDFKSTKVLKFQSGLELREEVPGILKKLSNLRYLETSDKVNHCNLRYLMCGKLHQLRHLYTAKVYAYDFRSVKLLKKLSNLRYLQTTSGEVNLMCSQLHQLRHLYTGTGTVLPIKLSKIKKMTKLQTLWVAQAGPWMTELIKLTNLEKLGIVALDAKTMELLTIAIRSGGLDKLRSLLVQVDVFSSDLLEALSEKHYLQKFRLWGRIKKFPSQLPSNLIKLSLCYTHLSEDPMLTLEKLQHLLFLRLVMSYNGHQMVCSTNGFPKLQHLHVRRFLQLEEWVVEEGAMPCLTTCIIFDCKKLEMVPQGFKFLTMLLELEISDMPGSFVQRVKEGGEDWETIKHIPVKIIKQSSHSDLEQSSQLDVNVHIHIVCDNCEMDPIVGKRYKCKACYDEISEGFDLCENCYNTPSKHTDLVNQHQRKGHTYELIANRGDSPVPVNPDDPSVDAEGGLVVAKSAEIEEWNKA